MTSRTLGWIVGAFVLGLTLPMAILWNPAGWAWADSLVGRESAGAARLSGDMSGEMTGETAAESAKSGTTPERRVKYWRAPMDPNYIRNEPGKSPMGMDLIPVYEDEAGEDSGIRVSQAFLQNFGVRTAKAERGAIPVDVRTVGALKYNEKGIVSVSTKIEGWIETANVNYIGEPVTRGEVLFDVYSPQLVTTQQEYLASVQFLEKLRQGGGTPDSIERAAALVSASRDRLRYWDITEDQIDALSESGQVSRTFKIVSPVSGVVVSKMDDALEGMKLSPGMSVYKIADLSTIWAEIEIYEHQIQFARLGQTARIAVDAFPGRTWSGQIVFLDPAMNPRTRTLTAYVEIPNTDQRLRPEMYANVDLGIPAISGVVRVPMEAVIHTGERSVVIVEKETGLFEPREVAVGSIGNGYQEIRSGVAAGETVVISSQFLIDSESNLRAAINNMLSNADSGSGNAMPTMDMGAMTIQGSDAKGKDMQGMDMSNDPAGKAR